ncbi:MAG: DUF308 domain-containing protein [Methanoregula sp.]|jgi:uncharacterized membrane protein HdeD (DUF308 family)|nr:DUF308 domain-containing protein [Methanoregula sp.]
MTDDISQPEQTLADTQFFPWWLLLLWGILTLLVGFMFLINPGQTMEFFIIFLGAYWLVGGLFTIGSLFVDRSNMGWKIFLSVINILAGILILMYPLFSTIFVFTFMIIFIGFWACFIGAAHIYQAYTAKDAGNGVLGIIIIIFGLLLLINPFIAAALLPFVFGGFAIVSGLASIYVAFVAKGAQAAP